MTRYPYAAAIALAVVLLAAGCATQSADADADGQNAASSSATASPSEQPTAETPAAPTFVEVDPAAFTDEQVEGVTFGVNGGEVNCQIVDRGGVQWGCAVFVAPAWTWEQTQFADYCAGLGEVGCRNGLVVTDAAAGPMPRRNTDIDFGGAQSPNTLAEGERLTVGTISCVPEADGVRCEDSATEHGFTLSVASLEAW